MHESVCVERKLLIPGAKIEDVTAACQKAFKEMGLKIKQSEKTPDGSTTVMAGEGALVPLILRTLLYPFSVQEFIKAAQRSGVHVIVSPSKDGVVVYSCGLALDERTGKPAKYDEDDVEEITDTLEAIDFENKFLKKLQLVFPGTKEIE